MRVFALCSTDWIYTLPVGFKEAGYEVEKSGSISEEKLIAQLNKFKPDFIISMGWTEDQSIERQLIAKKVSKATKTPHVYWSVEDPAHTSSFSLPFLKRVQPDFVFSICRETVEAYKKIGIKSAYLDFGYNSLIHHPTEPKKQYKYSIALVANAYVDLLQNYPDHYRYQSSKNLITPLLKEGIRIDFWGSEWEKGKSILGYDIPKEWIHGELPYLDTNKVYNSSDIIIGLQNYDNMVTQRTYEILAAGGFLLTSDNFAVRNSFKVGKDLITSSSPEETVTLVKYYLKNEAERKNIARRAPNAVIGNSYRERAEYIIDVLYREGVLMGKAEY